MSTTYAPKMNVPETFPWPEKLPALRSTGPVLRRLERADIPALYEIFSDPEVMRYWGFTSARFG